MKSQSRGPVWPVTRFIENGEDDAPDTSAELQLTSLCCGFRYVVAYRNDLGNVLCIAIHTVICKCSSCLCVQDKTVLFRTCLQLRCTMIATCFGGVITKYTNYTIFHVESSIPACIFICMSFSVLANICIVNNNYLHSITSQTTRQKCKIM